MREIEYRQALREALAEEMDSDQDVFLLGEDIEDPFGGTYKVTKGLSSKYGQERVRNTPLSETAIIGATIGSALVGKRPVAELMYVDFTAVCMDMIVNQAAKIRYMSGGQVKVPMVIRTQGGTGRSSAAHHAQSLEAWFLHVPGIKVVMPYSPYDAKGLLKSAIRDDNPVLFIEHKLAYSKKGEVPEEGFTVPLGKAGILKEGTDFTIVSYSLMLDTVLEAARSLEKEGISVEVIDLKTIKPLDMEAIVKSVQKTNRLAIVHEACRTGGVGGEIAAQVQEKAFFYLDNPILRIAGSDVPVPFAPEMEQYIIPDSAGIVEEIKNNI